MFSIAPFRFDVTPPLGHALLGGLVPPAIAIDDPLEGIGYVLLSDEPPIVVCVLDWAGLMNDSHHEFRRVLADAAGTTPERVALHCVHQHNAPFVCEATRRLAARRRDLEPVFDSSFFRQCLRRSSTAIRDALASPVIVTHLAHGAATVDRVASNRRVDRDQAGRVRTMRGSSCTDPALVNLPEGTIDPVLRTIAFFAGDRKVAACHFYATHPMSYYRDGRVTSDFCGLARKRRQQDEPDCTHLYFSGCAGNVAAGKYNDGSPAAREALTQRLYEAIRQSESNLTPEPLRRVAWRESGLAAGSRPVPSIEALGATVGGPAADQVGAILQAFWRAWSERSAPVPLSCLSLNGHALLSLPGEAFIEYQLFAQSLRATKARQVCVAAYGDGGPWYIPPALEYPKGGYETMVAFAPPEIEARLRAEITALLA
jgi:hypothetical protein